MINFRKYCEEKLVNSWTQITKNRVIDYKKHPIVHHNTSNIEEVEPKVNCRLNVSLLELRPGTCNQCMPL